MSVYLRWAGRLYSLGSAAAKHLSPWLILCVLFVCIFYVYYVYNFIFLGKYLLFVLCPDLIELYREHLKLYDPLTATFVLFFTVLSFFASQAFSVSLPNNWNFIFLHIRLSIVTFKSRHLFAFAYLVTYMPVPRIWFLTIGTTRKVPASQVVHAVTMAGSTPLPSNSTPLKLPVEGSS